MARAGRPAHHLCGAQTSDDGRRIRSARLRRATSRPVRQKIDCRMNGSAKLSLAPVNVVRVPSPPPKA